MRKTAAVVALLLAASRLPAEERGEAEVALQGYYLGGNSQPLTDTSGLAFRFRYFLPNVGFLSGSFEGYGSQGKLETGDNFLELRGVPWAGRHWTFTGGTNYNDATGDVAIVINKANATINGTPYHLTYDGNSHMATGTATGVKGRNPEWSGSEQHRAHERWGLPERSLDLHRCHWQLQCRQRHTA
jgi:hypothetical protein